MTTREPFTGTRLDRAKDTVIAIVTYPLWIALALLLVATAIIWVPIALILYARYNSRLHAGDPDYDALFERIGHGDQQA